MRATVRRMAAKALGYAPRPPPHTVFAQTFHTKVNIRKGGAIDGGRQ